MAITYNTYQGTDWGGIMKKTVLLVCYLILILSLGGCRLVRIEEEKRMPLEYEVVEPEHFLRKRLHLWKKKRLQSSGSHIRAEKSFI